MKDYLYGLRNSGSKLGLERVERLAESLGNPHRSYKVVLVGGTSGKGSTAAMISFILMESGYKVGTFISPHLSTLSERIMVNCSKIPEERMSELVGKIRETVDSMEGSGFERPTFFEVVAAAAMLCFAEEKVDFAVFEVGLGGRLDATNITEPEVSVITNISLEHTRILGDTESKIAREKAGIIRGGRPLVTAAEGEALETIEGICKENGSPISRVGKDIKIKRISSGLDGQEFIISIGGSDIALRTSLLGSYQLENAACAVGAVMALGVDEEAIRGGILKTRWPGRMEIMQKSPLVILDCAKDAKAAKRLRQTMEEDIGYEGLVLVFGVSSDKSIRQMLSELAPIARKVIVTEHKVMDRAAEAEAVAGIAADYCGDCVMVYDVKEAVRKAISSAGPKDAVLVTGSIFTVGEAREIWFKGEGALGRGLNEVPGR